MRKVRVKRLTAIFNELVQRNLIPAKDERCPKRQWRKFKKMFTDGRLWEMLPGM